MCAWTAPKTFVTGNVLTAAELNTHVRDNFLETSVAKSTAAGDTTYATGANALARVAIGGAFAVNMVSSGGTAPTWRTGPATGFVEGALSGARHVERGGGTTSTGGTLDVTFGNAFANNTDLSVVLSFNEPSGLGSANIWATNLAVGGFTAVAYEGASQIAKAFTWIAEGPD